MPLLSQLGLRPIAKPSNLSAAPPQARPSRAAGADAPTRAKAAPSGKPKGELELGGATIVQAALGPEIPGPRKGVLWALMSADGSGPLHKGNSQMGAQLNASGRKVMAAFDQLRGTQKQWNDLYSGVEKMAQRSEADLKKMEQTAGAVGERTKGRRGAYVRGKSEAYLDAQEKVNDAIREIRQREPAFTGAAADVQTVTFRQQKLAAARDVEKAKGEVEAEKEAIAKRKAFIDGLFDVTLKMLKQDWAGLAEDAAKYVVDETFDSLPTAKLDQLTKQLEAAQSKLKGLEDLELLSELAGAAARMEEAGERMDDARKDLAAALDKLQRAQATAVEALSESRSTADAAQMVAKRGQMLQLMAAATKAIEDFQRESLPLISEFDRVASLYRAMPGVLRMTPNLDANGEHARSMVSTSNDNADTLAVWKAYVQDLRNRSATEATKLADTGETGFLKHFNRIAKMLHVAIVGR